jgi:hypothetical protein
MNLFCVNCEKDTETKDLEVLTLDSGKRALKGFCKICNSKKMMKLGKEGGDFIDSITGGKLFVGEMHLPLHQFTGPGTRTDLRLNPEDLTPKDWSLPINRVDEASLKHDIAYMDKSLEARHKADEIMIEELKNIENPTFRENLERKIIIPILQTKKWIGLSIAPKGLRDLLND